MQPHKTSSQYGPWNPGLSSVLPRELLPRSTMFSEQNVSTSIREAHELSDFCGLPAHECVALRPERLIVHEVLIRVTANVSIYPGRLYEDLGINFRRVVTTIIENSIAPQNDTLCRLFDANCVDANQKLRQELETTLFAPNPKVVDHTSLSLWHRLFGPRAPQPVERNRSSADRLSELLEEWEQRRAVADQDIDSSVLEALIKVVSGIASKHGRIVGDIDLIASIAGRLVSNSFGGRALGDAIEPIFRVAVQSEGYSLLPAQTKPVVMNVKGASASGKSTMRPHQQRLAEQIGLNWNDFALISPDIWRKYLLDYTALGADYKYAGMLAGHEVELIDRKLDHYMAKKAPEGAMTHLLIDRFRFDSFALDQEAIEHSRLLTRFGDLIYMFFMITAATVERAWRRGRMVGRYKAVDDLLDHNVEAFSGMPELFFTWALRQDKRVHCEFLDNSVPLGSLPKTIAFGWNGEMNILDVKGILDIDRFRKLRVDAKSPQEVHQGHSMAPEDNTEFLRRCAKMIPAINFANQFSGKVYARMENGKWLSRDVPALALKLQDPETRAGLEALGLTDADWSTDGDQLPRLAPHNAHTLGAWGPDAQSPIAGNFSR